MRRTAIYTAIFGGYDSLRVQPQIPGIDYVCFTDGAQPAVAGWKVIRAKSRFRHPRMSAKWYKARPDLTMLKQYDCTIWIDGGVQIETVDFAAVVLASMHDGLSLFRHPIRDSAMGEAVFCLPIEKYDELPMVEQVEHYMQRGFPDRTGLYAGTVFGRDMRNPLVTRLGKLWMRECVRWGYQDQLSLPYILWLLGIEPGVIPFDLWDGKLISMVAHASEADSDARDSARWWAARRRRPFFA